MIGKKYRSGIHIGILSIALLFLFTSCEKQNLSVYTKLIKSSTTADLFTIKKGNDNTIWICGGAKNESTMLKSNDGGYSFSKFGNGHYHALYDFEIINDSTIMGSAADLEFITTNNYGMNWKIQIPADDQRPKTGFLSDLYSYVKTDDGTIYLAGGEKFYHGVIYKSVDGGQNFNLTYRNHEMRDIIFLDNNNGIASAYGALYYTHNKGETWNQSNAENDFFTGLVARNNSVFCCSFEGGIFRSDDIGENWKCINKSNKSFSKRYHYNRIVFAPDGIRGICAGTEGNVAITYDGGITWNEGTAFDNNDINDIIFLDNDIAMAVGNKGVIYRFTF